MLARAVLLRDVRPDPMWEGRLLAVLLHDELFLRALAELTPRPNVGGTLAC